MWSSRWPGTMRCSQGAKSLDDFDICELISAAISAGQHEAYTALNLPHFSRMRIMHHSPMTALMNRDKAEYSLISRHGTGTRMSVVVAMFVAVDLQQRHIRTDERTRPDYREGRVLELTYVVEQAHVFSSKTKPCIWVYRSASPLDILRHLSALHLKHLKDPSSRIRSLVV